MQRAANSSTLLACPWSTTTAHQPAARCPKQQLRNTPCGVCGTAIPITTCRYPTLGRAVPARPLPPRQTVPEHYTTADVTELLVKPATLSSRCRYVDLVRPADPRAVGRAAFFVSHRWGCRFKGQLVAPLVQHLEARGRRGNGGGGGEGRAERQEEEGHQGHQAEEEQEEQEQEVYVWLDIFAVNRKRKAVGSSAPDRVVSCRSLLADVPPT